MSDSISCTGSAAASLSRIDLSALRNLQTAQDSQAQAMQELASGLVADGDADNIASAIAGSLDVYA